MNLATLQPGRFAREPGAASAAGKKGGPAAKKAHDKRKKLRELLIEIGQLDAPTKISAKLKEVFPKFDGIIDIDTAEAMVLKMKGVQGDINAIKTSNEIVNGKPKESVHIDGEVTINQLSDEELKEKLAKLRKITDEQ